MGIIIGADFVPTKTNEKLFESASLRELIGEKLENIITGADYRIFNLEMPLTDHETPISKQGPGLRASTKSIAAYNAAKVNLVTLANNHIMDQGVQGLESTLNILRENGIAYVGVGASVEEAQKPFYFDYCGKKVGVYACVEHEFSYASQSAAGANPIDELDAPDHISELKKQCDFVIVLYHGGKEHYRYPSPRLQKLCRKLAERGADLVVCQHSHCIGCEEKYQGSTIVYGQGNFVFDHSSNECWQTGLLVALDENFSVQYIPVVKTDATVRMANDREQIDILDAFRTRSEEIADPELMERRYQEFSELYLKKYLYAFSGRESLIFRALNRLTKNRLRNYSLEKKYQKKQFLAIRNFVECEAHRELLLQALKKRT